MPPAERRASISAMLPRDASPTLVYLAFEKWRGQFARYRPDPNQTHTGWL